MFHRFHCHQSCFIVYAISKYQMDKLNAKVGKCIIFGLSKYEKGEQVLLAQEREEIVYHKRCLSLKVYLFNCLKVKRLVNQLNSQELSSNSTYPSISFSLSRSPNANVKTPEKLLHIHSCSREKTRPLFS